MEVTTYRSRIVVLAVVLLAIAWAWGCATEEAQTSNQDVAQEQRAIGRYSGAPYLGELRNSVLYGDVWERPELSPRDRSLIMSIGDTGVVRDRPTSGTSREGARQRGDARGDCGSHYSPRVLFRLAEGCQRVEDGGRGLRGAWSTIARSRPLGSPIGGASGASPWWALGCTLSRTAEKQPPLW